MKALVAHIEAVIAELDQLDDRPRRDNWANVWAQHFRTDLIEMRRFVQTRQEIPA